MNYSILILPFVLTFILFDNFLALLTSLFTLNILFTTDLNKDTVNITLYLNNIDVSFYMCYILYCGYTKI